MDPLSPMMSTPKSARSGVAFFWEFTHLRSKLFGDSASEGLDISHETTNRSTSSELFLECRHSPRLLTNGYYIWNEDSCLCKMDANVSVSPAKLKVPYKETLVRIFRKRRRRMDLRDHDIQGGEISLQCLDQQHEDDSENNTPGTEFVNPCSLKSTTERDNQPQGPPVHSLTADVLCGNNEIVNLCSLKTDHPEKNNQPQGPPVHPLTADVLCGSDVSSSWKSHIQTVTLFFTCFLISLWARSWLTKLLANLLTSVMVLSIIGFVFPHPVYKRPSQMSRHSNQKMLPSAIHTGSMTSSSSK